MADYKLLGKNYQTPDLYAKVTGRSRYAEDHRVEGMVFCKLLVSPMPHARVRSIDTSAAEALPGVEGLLTADDLPDVAAPNEAALTNEPLYEGEPILAVAAVDEQTAADAIELIELDLEPLPFALDPLDSLHPGGPNARLDGNTMRNRELDTIKWTEADVAGLAPGEIPMAAEAGEEWEYGDLAAGFAEADVVVEEHSYHQSLSHQPLESRTTLAYWDGGKLYVYPSVQSTARSVGPMARYAGVEPSDVVLINEYTGGGFGSKGSGYPQAQIPILLSKKIGKPVMMRVTRRDETSFGKARPGMQCADQARDATRWPDHRTGYSLYRRWRPLWTKGRHDECRWHRVGRLPAGGDADARHQRLHEHAAARRAACAGWRAVDDDALADYPEGRQAARTRPGRCAEDQCAGRPGALRCARGRRPAEPRVQRVRQGGDRQGCRALQLARAGPAQRPAHRLEGDRYRRRAQHLFGRRLRRRRAVRDRARWPECTSSPVSATWAPGRPST